MADILMVDRVSETTLVVGVGTLTLTGPSGDNYEEFQTYLNDGDLVYYCILDATNNDYEVGWGAYSFASGNILTRNVLRSTNNDNLVDFQPGTKTVFSTAPADFLNDVLTSQESIILKTLGL